LRITILAGCIAVCLSGASVIRAQQTTIPVEPPTPLTQPAVAFDSDGQRVLEATLRTTTLHGAPDTPVTNTRIVLKNVSQKFYDFVSGHVTFYDSANVRCGEGVVKTGAFAPNESAETDTPGIRITCAPASWRIVGTHLVPRIPEGTLSAPTANLVISIDGEEHPIQLGKPMVLTLADRQRTIVVRTAP
jgi:hypothetical protein